MGDQTDGLGEAALSPRPLHIVAIGASAGGLDALKEFFGAVHSSANLAYVVVTHMQRERSSHMAELLTRAGVLRATEAIDGERVEGGRVYVIPPGTLLSIAKGKLVVEPLTPRPSMPKPIDYFMQALAADAGPRAIGIILSGTDHDGTLGAQAIVAAGGLALAQVPGSAQYRGMPDSVIESGVIDLVLEPRQMPAALADRIRSGHERPDVQGDEDGEEDDLVSLSGAASDLDAVLKIVLDRTGHDFRWYRPGMLRRRLHRRMSQHRILVVDDYLRLLAQSGEEIVALKDEFLIGVTDFFRDPEIWQLLTEEVVPPLVASRRHDDAPIRVWTPGCATGEETYSVAMMLLEQLDGSDERPAVQVFGTDIDQDALATARAGSYPESIAADVGPERLARFFRRRGDRYVVSKELRDAVMFAPQDLVRDTPFSKLDMVICRNLLIYFEPGLQARVLQLFHFALRPRGLLVLGKAESVGAQSGLFEALSASRRVFRRTGGRTHLPRDFVGSDAFMSGKWGLARRGSEPRVSNAERLRAYLGTREVVAAALIDRDGRVLFFHGKIGPFLEPQGEASLDLISLVRAEFRATIRRMLRQTSVGGPALRQQVSLLGDAGRLRPVALEVCGVSPSQDEGLFAVLFDFLEVDAEAPVPASAPPSLGFAAERDMEDHRRELALALEDAERSNDDLRMASEESLALNEELQSSNEELESSKEELQSLNEELATVNAQLEDKVAELARNQDDLTNLLSSTHIATILLDTELRIRKFTPAARTLFTLQPGDEGRLLSDISARTQDPAFETDLKRVLETSVSTEAEVRAGDGRTLLRRVLPFRGIDASTQGAVITYIDVSELVKSAQQARHLAAALSDSSDAVVTYNLDGTLASWNEGARRAYGYEKESDENSSLFAHIPADQLSQARQFLREVVEKRSAGPLPAERLAKDGRTVKVSVTATALCDDQGAPYAILATERDITAQLEAASEARFKRLADDIPALLRVEDVARRTDFVNRAFAQFVGRERDKLLGHGWLEFVHPLDQSACIAAATDTADVSREEGQDFRLRRSDGMYRWMRSFSVPQQDPQGHHSGFVTLTLDVETRKRAELELLEADQRKDQYLAMLAHELRNPLAPIRNAVSILGAVTGLSANAQWATGVIERQVGAMARLLDDLLDVSRLAQGKVKLAIGPLDVGVLVERAVEISRPLIDSKDHTLVVSLSPEPLRVEGDLVRLAQVLSNLLNNAAKYTDRGGRIELSVTQESGQVALRVRDNGTGISPDMLQRVFDVFAQADRTLDRAHGGLGLGLTLARHLVEIHRGTISAHSAGLGKGSEFLVLLPKLSTSGTGSEMSNGTQRAADTCARKVMIVDDNEDAGESLGLMLETMGHEVRVVQDATACLQSAEAFEADAFVLDIGLPGMNGFELAARLRARAASANATLIALTGYGQADDVSRSRAAGFDHHLVKPVAPEQVDALIARGRQMPIE